MRRILKTQCVTIILFSHLSGGVEGSADGFGCFSLVQRHARDERCHGVGLCCRQSGDVCRKGGCGNVGVGDGMWVHAGEC